MWRRRRLFTLLYSSNWWPKRQESIKNIPRRRCDLSGNTADDVIILYRARIKYIFGSRWSVYLVKRSELKCFVRGFPPREATLGILPIDTSPRTDSGIATIRRKRPEHIQKEEIWPSRLRKTPSWKELLKWTLFKSSRGNLQDNRNVIGTLQNNGQAVKGRGNQADLARTSIVWLRSITKETIGRKHCKAA